MRSWKVVLGWVVLLGVLVTGAIILSGQMPPKYLHVRPPSQVFIVELEKVHNINGAMEYNLHYTINGEASIVWFHDKHEVKIFLDYLSSLGSVDFGWNIPLSQGIME